MGGKGICLVPYAGLWAKPGEGVRMLAPQWACSRLLSTSRFLLYFFYWCAVTGLAVATQTCHCDKGLGHFCT